MSGNLKCAFVLAIVLGSCAPRARADNWPGWRGPTRNGVSAETEIPWQWDREKGVGWKIPVPGSGISNPIVWDDRVIVTASDGYRQAELHVICFARDDGRELWHQRLWGTAPTRYHGTKSSMATPAPVTDGKHIYVNDEKLGKIRVLEPETLTVRTSITLWPEPHETTIVIPSGQQGVKGNPKVEGSLPLKKG